MKRKRPLRIVDIVADYLKTNGYDGLAYEDTECGCTLDDLAPCDGPCYDCMPAYNHEPNPTRPFRMLPRKPRRKRNAP